MTTEHTHRVTSWVTVGVIILASVLLGLALPLESTPLGIAGGVTLVVGILMGVVYRIMDDSH
ncbi:MAG TPA: hypothetical protein VNA30_04655 [Mycobacteriales bacterium]|nr:hypothetical protein [Mycobacteriales bacterium]